MTFNWILAWVCLVFNPHKPVLRVCRAFRFRLLPNIAVQWPFVCVRAVRDWRVCVARSFLHFFGALHFHCSHCAVTVAGAKKQYGGICCKYQFKIWALFQQRWQARFVQTESCDRLLLLARRDQCRHQDGTHAFLCWIRSTKRALSCFSCVLLFPTRFCCFCRISVSVFGVWLTNAHTHTRSHTRSQTRTLP